MVKGLWHAHTGWLFETHGQASSKRYARDLLEDPTMRRINRSFPLIALASLLIPFLLGLAFGGGVLTAGLSALLWGGLVRIFLVHHVTWSINSICHFFGSRRFETGDESTNVFWLALPSLGEAWHHNHHAFPQSAFHGLRWYELDPRGRGGRLWETRSRRALYSLLAPVTTACVACRSGVAPRHGRPRGGRTRPRRSRLYAWV
jgi:stearoyl-CoA desaturase (delta-9 desaturase)